MDTSFCNETEHIALFDEIESIPDGTGNFFHKNVVDIFSTLLQEVNTSLTDKQTDMICMIIAMYEYIMHSKNLKLKEGISKSGRFNIISLQMV